MFQATALEVVVEFSLHIQGNRTALLLHERQELRVILVDNLVEKCLLRPMTLITGVRPRSWQSLPNTRCNPLHTVVMISMRIASTKVSAQ